MRAHKWNMACKHAPANSLALHCRKQNEGKKSDKSGRGVGKGYYGCASRCRFLEENDDKGGKKR